MPEGRDHVIVNEDDVGSAVIIENGGSGRTMGRNEIIIL